MMNGGAALEYLQAPSGRPKNTILRLQQLQLPGPQDTERIQGDSTAQRRRRADPGQGEPQRQDSRRLLGPQRQEAATQPLRT